MRSNPFRDFAVSTLSLSQLRYAKERQALAHYRSHLEPLPPQAEPALPRDRLRLIVNEAEYFFRFVPSASGVRQPARRVI